MAAGTEAVEEVFTAVGTEAVGDTALEVCVRVIPLQAVQGVPDIQLPVVPVVRATRSQVAPVIHIADTGQRRRWVPQRPAPRTTGVMALTINATMPTAIGSVRASIGIESHRTHLVTAVRAVLTAVKAA